jgi:shikimate dehydrogenase
VENELIPALGVYATRTTLGRGHYESVTNIGMRPTFGGKRLTVETHLLNFKKSIYGKKIRLVFLKKNSGGDDVSPCGRADRADSKGCRGGQKDLKTMKKTKARKFAIIGDPVAHSLSPAMHNAAFRAKRLPYRYSKIRLKPQQLPSFFKKIREKNYRGLNVTVPHKESVMAYLDEIAPEARLIGAVNTILLEEGKLKGFNTDGAGYLCSLKKETGFSLQGKYVVILGAGERSVRLSPPCLGQGIKELTLANRTPLRARKLALEFQKKFPRIPIRAVPLKDKFLKPIFKKTDLLINTTSIGLKKEPFPSLPLHHLPKRALVSDIVYKPAFTPLLSEAKKAGQRVHPGLGMLLHQGALAFEIWTNRPAPVSLMKKVLIKKIGLKITRR